MSSRFNCVFPDATRQMLQSLAALDGVSETAMLTMLIHRAHRAQGQPAPAPVAPPAPVLVTASSPAPVAPAPAAPKTRKARTPKEGTPAFRKALEAHLRGNGPDPRSPAVEAPAPQVTPAVLNETVGALVSTPAPAPAVLHVLSAVKEVKRLPPVSTLDEALELVERVQYANRVAYRMLWNRLVGTYAAFSGTDKETLRSCVLEVLDWDLAEPGDRLWSTPPERVRPQAVATVSEVTTPPVFTPDDDGLGMDDDLE